ncbi:copper chaperone PCu(A)C [Methylocystis sp. IM3]|uniref:copper chaperone PCu(A)C n=1 Tax=unclassified Methylocystis TaxID=2625913 RepID=UPI0030F99A7C
MDQLESRDWRLISRLRRFGARFVEYFNVFSSRQQRLTQLGQAGFAACMIIIVIERTPPIALAQDFMIGHLKVENPHLRMPNRGENSAFLSMIVHNNGDTPDTLVNVTSRRLGRAVLHNTSKHIVVSKGIIIPPHAAVLLEPGRPFVSFQDITDAFSVGKDDEIMLVFEKSGELMIEAEVEATDSYRLHDR